MVLGKLCYIYTLNIVLHLGFGDDVIQKLKSTVVMQKVLRYMCTSRDTHGLNNGWGKLEPWEYLNDPNKLYSLIETCTTDIEDIDWRGRNI